MLMPDDIDLQAEPDVCPCCHGVVGGCTECGHRRTREAFEQHQALEDEPVKPSTDPYPKPRPDPYRLSRSFMTRGGR